MKQKTQSVSSVSPGFELFASETVLSNPRLAWERYVEEEHSYITWSRFFEKKQVLHLFQNFQGEKLEFAGIETIDIDMAIALVQATNKRSISAEQVDKGAVEVFRKHPERSLEIHMQSLEICGDGFLHIRNDYCEEFLMEEEHLMEQEGETP